MGSLCAKRGRSRIFFDDPLIKDELLGTTVCTLFRSAGDTSILTTWCRQQAQQVCEGFGREQRKRLELVSGEPLHTGDYNDEFIYQFAGLGLAIWCGRFRHKPPTGLTIMKRGWLKMDASRDGIQMQNTWTFNALYEQVLLSYAELFRKRDLIDIQPVARLNPIQELTLTPKRRFYWRESDRTTLRGRFRSDRSFPGKNSTARYIGSHAALQRRWT